MELDALDALQQLRNGVDEMRLLRSWSNRLTFSTPLPDGIYFVEGHCRDSHGAIAAVGKPVIVTGVVAYAFDKEQQLAALEETVEGAIRGILHIRSMSSPDTAVL